MYRTLKEKHVKIRASSSPVIFYFNDQTIADASIVKKLSEFGFVFGLPTCDSQNRKKKINSIHEEIALLKKMHNHLLILEIFPINFSKKYLATSQKKMLLYCGNKNTTLPALLSFFNIYKFAPEVSEIQGLRYPIKLRPKLKKIISVDHQISMFQIGIDSNRKDNSYVIEIVTNLIELASMSTNILNRN